MAQLNVRIDDAARGALDALAQARGVSSGDIVRSLVDDAVGHRRRDGEPYGSYADVRPPTLSVLERRTLAWEHRVLALLSLDRPSTDSTDNTDNTDSTDSADRNDSARGTGGADVISGASDDGDDTGDGADRATTSTTPTAPAAPRMHFGREIVATDADGHPVTREDIADGDCRRHLRLAEVLEAGYSAEYPDLFVGIRPELSARDCALVRAILEMFHHLTYAWTQLDDAGRDQVLGAEEHAEHLLTFRGFDFNDPYESRLVGYARYLVDTGHWSQLAFAFDDAHERGNSHMPYLSHYQRLLNAWTPLWRAKLERARTNSGRDVYAITAADVVTLLAGLQHRQREPTSRQW